MVSYHTKVMSKAVVGSKSEIVKEIRGGQNFGSAERERERRKNKVKDRDEKRMRKELQIRN